MAQTIEAFVNRLQADGVEAGQAEAAKILALAEQQAQTRLAEAAVEAKRIVAQAEAESQSLRERTETELKLAARDLVLRLQEALNRALQAVLVDAVRERLEHADFLGSLIRDVVLQYATADAAGHSSIVIQVSDAMRQQLLGGAVAALRPEAPGSPPVDLRGTLAEAGFAYQVSDGTVEVTLGSIVEVLSEMAGTELRKRVAEAVEV